MKVTRVYAGPDGETHFEDLDIPLEDHGDVGRLSEFIKATGIIFRETAEDYDYDWHNAPQRQFVISLDGEFEIRVSDGSVRRFGPGAVVLVEDTAGKGHISRTVNNQPRRSIFVTLD